jgi:inhibitor of cysteine peptidase
MKFHGLLAAALLAGCATNHSVTVVTPQNAGTEIRVAPGQILVVKLPGNPTTGYSWQDRIAGDATLELCGKPEFQPDAAPSGMVGVGGTEIWKFKALKPGRETLRMEYSRPWMTNTPPDKTLSFDVLVGE